jgi:hypothetical protein
VHVAVRDEVEGDVDTSGARGYGIGMLLDGRAVEGIHLRCLGYPSSGADFIGHLLELRLLCFESDPADCHRGLWAEWWFQQTGGRVPELRPEGEEKRPDGPQPSQFDGEETA